MQSLHLVTTTQIIREEENQIKMKRTVLRMKKWRWYLCWLWLCKFLTIKGCAFVCVSVCHINSHHLPKEGVSAWEELEIGIAMLQFLYIIKYVWCWTCICNLNLILIMLSNHCNSTIVQSDEFMQIKLEKVNNSMLRDLHYGGLGACDKQ